MAKDLIKPGHNVAILGLLRMMLPFILSHEKLNVRTSANCIDAVHRFKNMPTVIVMNHSDRLDPLCAFALSGLVEEDFYYLSSREQFDGFSGLQGWLLQQCGAYSVIRGEPEDLESKELTISLIAEGKRKMIMFPEGDVSGRADAILPMKEDGVLNMLAAQQRLLSNGDRRPVCLLPIAIAFDVTSDAIQPMEDALVNLEHQLSLPFVRDSWEVRIGRIIESVIDQLETNYAITAHGSHWHERLLDIARQVTAQIALLHGLTLSESYSNMVFLHSCRNRLRRLIEHPLHYDTAYGATTGFTKYGERLRLDAAERASACMKDLDKMEQLLILASTVHQTEFSASHVWRLIDRLEMVVLGKAKPKGHRIARMEAAPIITLQELVIDKVKHSHAVHIIDRQVRDSLYIALQKLESVPPVPVV